MTIAQQDQRNQAQPHPQPEQRETHTGRDLAREHGNHIAAIADIAEAQLEESEAEREDRNRYEDGLQVLRWLVTAPWPERNLEIDRVLHDGHGSLSPEKIGEYVGLLIGGMSSLEARYEMASRRGRRAARAQATRDAVAAARLVSANLHRMAEAPLTQPALPPSGAARVNGTQLPRRAPIVPARPAMYPPAPAETEAQTTGQMLAVLQEETADGAGLALSAATIQRLQDSGFGPSGQRPGRTASAVPDPAFGAASIPAARAGDTQRFAPVASADGEDGSEPDDAPEPRPFPEADTAQDSGGQSGRGDGDDD